MKKLIIIGIILILIIAGGSIYLNSNKENSIEKLDSIKKLSIEKDETQKESQGIVIKEISGDNK